MIKNKLNTLYSGRFLELNLEQIIPIRPRRLWQGWLSL